MGIGYEVPWRRVEALLREAAEQTPGLLTNRAAFVPARQLGDFAVIYELNAYCDRADQMQAIYSELHHNILDLFNAQGIQIMTPHYVADSEPPKLAPAVAAPKIREQAA